MVAGVIPAWIVYTYGALVGWGLPAPLDLIPSAVGLAIGLVGLVLAAGTIRRFATQGKGTLAPWDPPRKLVVAGVYRYVRNPMISGVLGILAGEGIFFCSIELFTWFAIFAAANAIYIPLFEEPGLDLRYGRDYLTYKAHVPRWIPRHKPWEPDWR
jgi:protein-S-isoprenylcysteine O-methyltransferase Ste14